MVKAQEQVEDQTAKASWKAKGKGSPTEKINSTKVWAPFLKTSIIISQYAF